MKRWFLLAATLALVLGAVGGGAVLAQQGQARLRVVHAVPDAPPVDVLVDGNVAFSNVPYKGITPYSPLSAGAHRVQVVPTGTGQPPLIDTSVDLPANRDNTFLAVGRLADIEPLTLVDDNTLPPAGQAKVRFVHASPNAPPVDVAVRGGPVLFADVPFKGVGDYVTLNAGTFDLEVRAADAGLQTPTSGEVLLLVPSVRLGERTVNTVYAVGLLNEEPPLEVIISVDATPLVAPPAVGVRATATLTRTPPASPTPTVTPSSTPSPTPSPTPSATPSATPTATEAVSPTPTGVASPSPTGVASPTPTGVASPSPTGAVSPTPEAAATPTGEATPGGTPASPPVSSPTP